MVGLRHLAAFFGLILGCGALALAQQPAANPDEIIVRTYNVADLVRTTTNYPLNPPAPQPDLFGAQAQQQPPQATPQVSPQMVELMQLLTDTIDRESWRDNGGTVGNIRITGSLLVVANSRKNQDAIQQILNEIRRTGGPAQVVTVRLTWLEVNPRELLKPTSEVTAEWMEKQKTYCESQITCFSGQTVSQTSGSDESYVSDLTPVVASGSVGYDPQIGRARTGLAMQISPQLIPDSESVILDVQASVSESTVKDPPMQVVSLSTDPTGKATQIAGNVDRVNVVNQQFKTTARVPLHKKVIVGGMTLEPSNTDQAGRQLYLVVEMDTVK